MATRTIDELVLELQSIVGELSSQVDRWKMEHGTCDNEPNPGVRASVEGERLAASADHLAKQISDLSAAMATLRRTQEQDKRLLDGFQNVVRKLKILVRFDIALSIALFVVGLILGSSVIHDRVVSNRLEASIHAQCSLYQLLIPSWRGSPPPGNPVTADQYRYAYVEMQKTADLLNCGIKHVVPGT